MQAYQSTPDFYNDYISHHGILGMKWGKRNGPPYPLGAEDHSASEKKAGYKKSIKGSDTDAGISKTKKHKHSKLAKPNKQFEKEYKDILNSAKTDEEKDIRIRELDKKYANPNITKTDKKVSNSKQEKINKEIDNTNVKKEEYGYGDTKFEFSILPVKKENGKYVEFHASELSDQQLKDSAKDYKKNEKQIQDLAKEAILDDPYIYDSWIKDYHNMSKQEFINKLEIKSVYCTEYGAEVSVYEKDGYNLLGGHSLDMEFDLKNPKKPKWVAMNG